MARRKPTRTLAEAIVFAVVEATAETTSVVTLNIRAQGYQTLSRLRSASSRAREKPDNRVQEPECQGNGNGDCGKQIESIYVVAHGRTHGRHDVACGC